MKSEAKVLGAMLSTPLFAGVCSATIEEALKRGEFVYRCYAADEAVYSPECESRHLTFFLSGEAEVYSNDESRSVMLRKLTSGAVIGVANLFSDEKYVSRIIATKKCEVLEISAADFGKILESDQAAMYNYMSFLSNRICYLNKKIVCLTAGSSERRLAYYLDATISEQEEKGIVSNTVTVQMNTLCEMLNLGRASLYRAVERLCNEGFITRDGKSFTVKDREGMRDKYK